MRLSETARVYQLKNGHNLQGELTRGDESVTFKYGVLHDNRTKTTYVHGIEGGQSTVEIETVEPIKAMVGDEVELVNGRKGVIVDNSTNVLDELQLRFVSYEKADKVQRITLRYL